MNPGLNRKFSMKIRRRGQETLFKIIEFIVGTFHKMFTDLFTGEEGATKSTELGLAYAKGTNV